MCCVLLLVKAKKKYYDGLLQETVIFGGKSTEIGPQDGVLETSYGEPVSYAISSIAVAIFLVATFAGADL